MSTTNAPAKPSQPPLKPEQERPDPLAWLRARPKVMYGLVGGLAVVALGTWLVVETGQRRQDRAAEALDRARATAEAGNLPLAASQLQQLIETFGGTEAASEAVVTLNQVRMVNGQSQLAVVGLQDYLKTNPDKQYRIPALGLLGEALENAGKPADAGEAYLKAAADAEVDYLKAQYLLFAGRAFRNAADTAKAFKALDEIVQKYPKTTALTEAKVRLSELTQGRMALGS